VRQTSIAHSAIFVFMIVFLSWIRAASF